MYRKKRLLVIIGCVLTAAAFLGCAAPNSNLNTGNAPFGAGAADVYDPKVRPGIETLDAARKDLALLLNNPKRPVGIKYNQNRYKFPNSSTMPAFYGKYGLSLLDFGSKGYYDGRICYVPRGESQANFYLIHILKKNIPVMDDGIEVPLAYLYYDDLVNSRITVSRSIPDTRFGALQPYIYVIDLQGRISFLFHEDDLADAQRMADDLFTIQQPLKKQKEDRLARFESQAAQYRTLAIKPPVSEEQRRLIVQANALNQSKDYAGAIDLYLKAIDLDLVSYPAAYFNLALLSAQLQRYDKAIAYMKQYLMLVPDAPDARSAQDKIYEWEFMMQGKK